MTATQEKHRWFSHFAMNDVLFHIVDIFHRHQRAIATAIMVVTLEQPTALLAQSTTAPAQPTEDVEEVVVTGRVVPGAVIGDIPPENQLNPRDIASYGVSTINDLLNEIADQTQSDRLQVHLH